MSLIWRLLVVLVALTLSACSIPKPRPNIYQINTDQPVVALVLGEGMARSFAHVGVIKALQEEEVPIHLVVGSGMGAMMAALYANKLSANDLEWHAMSFKKSTYLKFEISDFLKKRLVHKKIEKLPVPIILTATDLKTGKTHLFEKGDISTAVRSALVIPGFFRPVRFSNQALVSNEISRGIPVDVAVARGADFIIAVDLMQGIEHYGVRKNQEITLQSYKITSAALSKSQLKLAHIVISPKVKDIDFLDFDSKRKAMLAGYDAAREIMPQLVEILDLKEED